MNKEIKRDFYLNQLLERRHNGLIKIVSGVRRCGKSYLLRRLFKQHLLAEGVKESQIIEMAFDLFENSEYRDPNIFFRWVMDRVGGECRYYFLLDEIQLLGEFVSVLNSLADKENFDVYVTGSNARFLSKDIATEFGGRGDEVRMFSLSFAEFMSVYDGHYYDGWNEYVRYGGIPLVVLADSDERKIRILENLFEETYIRDIILRYKVRNISEMKELLDIMSSAIGSLINPNKLRNAFRSLGNSQITTSTIAKYISYLEDSFLIETARRYDLKGKSYIGTPFKYYFSDIGLRNARINFRQQEITHAMENVIYNELIMLGYNVDVGNIEIVERNKTGDRVKKQIEVDFVCRKGSQKYYIQSAFSLESEEKIVQEVRPFLKIQDSFKKVLVVGTPQKPFFREDGIYVVSIYDFLLKRDWDK